MPSTDVIASLRALKLFGMANSYDEMMNESIRSKKTLAQLLWSLCQSETEERRMRSIRYQMA